MKGSTECSVPRSQEVVKTKRHGDTVTRKHGERAGRGEGESGREGEKPRSQFRSAVPVKAAKARFNRDEGDKGDRENP